MNRLAALTTYLLLALGILSFIMAVIGRSLTPLVLGGLLLGLGILIHSVRRLDANLSDLAASIRYNAYKMGSHESTPPSPEPQPGLGLQPVERAE